VHVDLVDIYSRSLHGLSLLGHDRVDAALGCILETAKLLVVQALIDGIGSVVLSGVLVADPDVRLEFD
jgi:hypothetical protein